MTDLLTRPEQPAVTQNPATWTPLLILAAIIVGLAVATAAVALRSHLRTGDAKTAPGPAPAGTFHAPARCVGPCPVHAPSAHHMADWDKQYRLKGIFERICPDHRTGHPDPDSLAHLRDQTGVSERRLEVLSQHTCCGCCAVPDGETEPSVP